MKLKTKLDSASWGRRALPHRVDTRFADVPEDFGMKKKNVMVPKKRHVQPSPSSIVLSLL